MFKVGDKVTINPNWEAKDPCYGDYGISRWRCYVGEVFTIAKIGEGHSYTLEEVDYFWPEYMLMPAETIKDFR